VEQVFLEERVDDGAILFRVVGIDIGAAWSDGSKFHNQRILPPSFFVVLESSSRPAASIVELEQQWISLVQYNWLTGRPEPI